METDWLRALIGGGAIGGASLLLLSFNGRIFGVSGIIGTALKWPKGDTLWRLSILLGLILGGLAFSFMSPDAFEAPTDSSFLLTGVAGLLVGLGTRLGNGCTSGHGICGVSRLSIRSIAATVTFLLFGIFAATASGLWGN